MEKRLAAEDEQGMRDRLKVGLDGIASQCAALQELMRLMQVKDPGMDGEEHCQGARCGPVAKEGLAGQGTAGPLQEAGVQLSEQKGGSSEGARQGNEAPRPAESLTLREGRDRVEKGMISAAVGKCGGNMARASELLGVSRSALYDLMKKHGLFKGTRHPSDHYAHAAVARHELAEKVDGAEPL
jgi:transcriptional regulator with GAF, ATPase, and Fis domain